MGRHTPLDYIFFTRPVLMLPVWTIALLGAHSVQAPAEAISAWRWVAMFVQLWCLFGPVYTLNQIFDIESDRANRKLFFLPENLISLKAAWAFTILLNVAALALAMPLGLSYLFLTVVIVFLGVVYSAGRHPWKNHALLGFLANVVAHGVIVFTMGVAFAGGILASAWTAALPYGLAVGAVYLATTAADVPGDRATGKNTVAVHLGVGNTMLVAVALVLAALALALRHSDRFLAIAALISLPFFLISAISMLRPPSSPAGLGSPPFAAKAAVGLLTLAAVVAYPIYLAFLVPGFFATRAFFRWRFGMTYPSLK